MPEPVNRGLQPLAEIDKLIHEPARLTIMSHLFVVEQADFLFLKNQTKLTWGNLSAHLSKLEAAGYVSIKKTYKKKKPYTILKLTQKGRQVFKAYQKAMKGFFKGF